MIPIGTQLVEICRLCDEGTMVVVARRASDYQAKLQCSCCKVAHWVTPSELLELYVQTRIRRDRLGRKH